MYILYKYQRIVSAVIVVIGVSVVGVFVRLGVKTPQFSTTVYEVSCDLPPFAEVGDCVRERTFYTFQPVSVLTVRPPAGARTRVEVKKGMVWQPFMFIETLTPGVYVTTEVAHDPIEGEVFIQASSLGSQQVYVEGECTILDDQCLLRVQKVTVRDGVEEFVYDNTSDLKEVVASIYGEASFLVEPGDTISDVPSVDEQEETQPNPSETDGGENGDE